MIRCSADLDGGGRLVILGVTPANLRELKNGRPILVDLTAQGLPGSQLCIMFGPTDRAIVAEIRSGGIEIHALEGTVDETLAASEREHCEKGTNP